MVDDKRHHVLDVDNEASEAAADEIAPGLGKIMRTGTELGEAFMSANEPIVKAGILYAFAPSLGNRALCSHLLLPNAMKGEDKRKMLQELIGLMALSLAELVNIAEDVDSPLFKDRVLQ